MTTYDPARGAPRVVPFLHYQDVAAAVAWLSKVYGFRERLHVSMPDGTMVIAELAVGEVAYIGLSGAPDGYLSPAESKEPPPNQTVVFVDDVDDHFARARSAGAAIVSEPTDKPWGLRQYLTADLEGQLWEFTQFLRDVPPTSWGATTTP